MRTKGIVLIALGALGAILVCTFDIIMGKELNDITGPKSIAALIVCGALITTGIWFLLCKPRR